MLSVDDVRRAGLEDAPDQATAKGDCERIAGASRKRDGGQAMHVPVRVTVTRIARGADMHLVALLLQLSGEGLHRDYDTIDDRVIALGEEGDTHI
jgi:hypothetical protein